MAESMNRKSNGEEEMRLEKVIRNTIETECEDYFLGMVDLSQMKNSLKEQYGSLLAEYPRAISIGVTLPYTLIELSVNKVTIYNEIYCHLKAITSHLSSLLENEGYKALSMPKTKEIENMSHISFHETVANLANLGKIEKIL